MKLTSILNPKLIFTELEGNSRLEIYSNMLKKAQHCISTDFSPDEYARALKDREDAIQIPWENGIALPHLRRRELEDLHIIIATLKNPIKLKERDKSESEVVLISLISEKTSDIYLKAVAAVSRFVMTSDNAVDKLKKCTVADEIINVFNESAISIKKEITAEDIMTREIPKITPNTNIRDVIDIFTRENKTELAVVDDNGKLLGVVDASGIVKKQIPPAVMMLENLNFFKSFEPFEKLLKSGGEIYVSEFIHQAKKTVSPNTPLIQLTVALAKEKARNLFVIDDEKKLLGNITFQELINNILRG